jgi:hypothetical protein
MGQFGKLERMGAGGLISDYLPSSSAAAVGVFGL